MEDGGGSKWGIGEGVLERLEWCKGIQRSGGWSDSWLKRFGGVISRGGVGKREMTIQ